jgi:hypothetical protein
VYDATFCILYAKQQWFAQNTIVMKTRILSVMALWSMIFVGSVRAADGFDNNFTDGDANQLVVQLSDGNHAILFGPGGYSSGQYFIQIPNGTVLDMGVVNTLKFLNVQSNSRSAYWDRVSTTTFYYRIYNQNGSPPSFTGVSLTTSNNLDPTTCYTTTQLQEWNHNFNFLNVIAGLPNGFYNFEFYTQLTLTDYGDETNPCNINASLLCQSPLHSGRFLSTQFNFTDPNVCPSSPNYYQSALSEVTKATFQITNSTAPLSWAAFQAQKKDNSIAIHWATAQEKEVEYFDLQRSNDGYNWKTIHHRSALGNTDFRTEYAYVDEKPLPGIDYYRLIAVDWDGTETISSTIAVPFGNGQKEIRFYPQPAGESVWMQLDENLYESAALLIIYDASGREIRRSQLPGQANEPLPVSDLGAGLYFVQIWNEEGLRLSSGRFIKS